MRSIVRFAAIGNAGRGRVRPVSEHAAEHLSAAEQRFERVRRTTGLVLGPLVFALLLLFPIPAPNPEAARLAAVLGFALVWWITEAVPIPVTALLAPALAVVLGIGTAGEMFAAFGDPIVFLFLGGFVLAEAMITTASIAASRSRSSRSRASPRRRRACWSASPSSRPARRRG